MVITLTEQALNKLKTTELEEGKYPRIEADYHGGCGVSIQFKLFFDEARPNDTVIEYDGIQIRFDRFTKRYLEEETQIDYNEEKGFIVGESFAQSACAIPVNE